MSSGMVISGSMVATFAENRPFTRSLSGKKFGGHFLNKLENSGGHFSEKPEESLRNTLSDSGLLTSSLRNVQSDAELLTSLGEDALPSPGALNNIDGLPQFLDNLSPSNPWENLGGKTNEWPMPSLTDEIQGLFDGQADFPLRPDSDAKMMDAEEGIHGSVEQTQPPSEMLLGDMNGVSDDRAGGANTDPFMSGLFDWDKLGNSPALNRTEENGQAGPAPLLKAKSASPAMRFTRSRSFELRKLVERKGLPADSVMRAIDEGRVDPAIVWARAAAENAAASRPNGVNKGQARERPLNMAEELKRLVNRNAQSTVPIRGHSRSPDTNTLSFLSPRLRELLDAQLPEASPSSAKDSEKAAVKASPISTIPLSQPRHRSRPQPLKGLTSAVKIEPLKAAQKAEPLRSAHSDPSMSERKRSPPTEMLPPGKRTTSALSDNALIRSSSSVSEVMREYSQIRTSNSDKHKASESRRKGRQEKEAKQAEKEKQRKSQKAAPTPAAETSAEPANIQLLVKAQKVEQLEEENRGLKTYLQFLTKKDGLQVKLIEQLEQQLMRVTDERNKLLAAVRSR